ncbi:hypothetical protein UB46_29305 [Burkholderiaceae bacterium 16]|nr:hypothetical protein UB46_29305 [Burkholderiaceae bacterium 16]
MIKTAIASLFLACAAAQGADSPVRIVFNDGVNTYIQARHGVALTVPDAVRRQDAFLVRGMPVEIIAYAGGQRYEIRRTGNTSQAYVVELVVPRAPAFPATAVTAPTFPPAQTVSAPAAQLPAQPLARTEPAAPLLSPPPAAAVARVDSRLAVHGSSDDEIRAAIAEAKARGWTSISAAGDPEFIVRVHALWNEVVPASPAAAK